MSIELSDKLNVTFGDFTKFHKLIDSHWPEIDRALRAQGTAEPDEGGRQTIQDEIDPLKRCSDACNA